MNKLKKSGEKGPNWSGGTKCWFRQQARKVMSNHLGRKLKKEEVVHHIDFNVENNNKKNLRLFVNNGKHLKYHWNKKKKMMNKTEKKDYSSIQVSKQFMEELKIVKDENHFDSYESTIKYLKK